jgi:hypothetical protein
MKYYRGRESLSYVRDVGNIVMLHKAVKKCDPPTLTAFWTKIRDSICKIIAYFKL